VAGAGDGIESVIEENDIELSELTPAVSGSSVRVINVLHDDAKKS
jgi:hypothetical protein